MSRHHSQHHRFTWFVCGFTEYGRFESADAFDEQFKKFLDRTRNKKMKLLSKIRT
jgi:hypothetical protein